MDAGGVNASGLLDGQIPSDFVAVSFVNVFGPGQGAS